MGVVGAPSLRAHGRGTGSGSKGVPPSPPGGFHRAETHTTAAMEHLLLV